MRPTPPMNTNAAMAATIMPVTMGGTSKAWVNALAMEFDCTMLPMSPSAMITAQEKKIARGLQWSPFVM